MKADGLMRMAVSFVGFAKVTTHSLSPHYGNRAAASGFLDPVEQSLNTLYASVDASVLKELRGINFNHRDLLFSTSTRTTVSIARNNRKVRDSVHQDTFKMVLIPQCPTGFPRDHLNKSNASSNCPKVSAVGVMNVTDNLTFMCMVFLATKPV